MKVGELIEKLQRLDKDSIVIIKSDNFELKGALVPVSFLHEYKTGDKSIREFRDTFDGETFQSEVYSISNGNEKIILIS